MSDRTPDARRILELALADVLGDATASHLRGDSPLLTTTGTAVLAAADAVGLADALEQHAGDAGLSCRLTDEDFVVVGSSLTVSDLQSRVDRRLAEGVEALGGERA